CSLPSLTVIHLVHFASGKVSPPNNYKHDNVYDRQGSLAVLRTADTDTQLRPASGESSSLALRYRSRNYDIVSALPFLRTVSRSAGTRAGSASRSP
ncbi:MAG: hypothetical protein WBV31_02735, partial [Terriglobales bacterium]